MDIFCFRFKSLYLEKNLEWPFLNFLNNKNKFNTDKKILPLLWAWRARAWPTRTRRPCPLFCTADSGEWNPAPRSSPSIHQHKAEKLAYSRTWGLGGKATSLALTIVFSSRIFCWVRESPNGWKRKQRLKTGNFDRKIFFQSKWDEI